MVGLDFLERFKTWLNYKERGSQPAVTKQLIHHRTVLDWVPNDRMEYETMSAPPFDIDGGVGRISRWNFYLKVGEKHGNNRVGVFLQGSHVNSGGEGDGESAIKVQDTPLEAYFVVHLVHPSDPRKTRECACPLNDYTKANRWGVANIVNEELLKDYAGETGKITLILDFFQSKSKTFQSDEIISETETIQNQIEICEQYSFADTINDIMKELQQGSYQDCVIQTSDGINFKAHKMILGGRSKYFAEVLRQERENQIVNVLYRFENGNLVLEVNRPSSVVKILLCHIYSGHLEEELLEQDKHSTEFVQEVVDASVEHGLESLKDFLLRFRTDLKDSCEDQGGESSDEESSNGNAESGPGFCSSTID